MKATIEFAVLINNTKTGNTHSVSITASATIPAVPEVGSLLYINGHDTKISFVNWDLKKGNFHPAIITDERYAGGGLHGDVRKKLTDAQAKTILMEEAKKIGDQFIAYLVSEISTCETSKSEFNPSAE